MTTHVVDAEPQPAGETSSGGPRPVPPMRILHVINMGTTCGGAERLVADLAAAQRGAGHTVRVLSSDRPGGGVRFSDATWHQPVRTGIWRRLAGLLRNPGARAALRAQLDGWQPTVVHLHTIGMLSPTGLRELAGTPTVLTLHGPEVFLRDTERWCMPARYFSDGAPPRVNWRGRLAVALQGGLVGRLWRRELRVVDVFVAPSRYLATLTERDFGATRVIPNGCAPSTVDVRTPSAPGVVFAGRLEHFKGPQVLVEAVPRVLAVRPETRFTVCGAGPMSADLSERIDDLGVDHAVDLTGWLDPHQVSGHIAGADVVVVPSLWPEAFGLTCLEAFAAGRPVVASDIGALPELVEHEVTGLLVPPDDPSALASAIGRLLDDEPLRRRLGEAGRRRSAAYGIAAHRRGVLDAYVEAVHASRAAGRGGALRRWIAGARADSLLRNSALLLLATAVLAGGGFLFWQLAARLFTPAEIGQAGALISVATLLANLAMLGMNNALIRYLHRWPDPARTVTTGVLVVAGAAAVGAGVFVAVSPTVAPALAAGLDAPRAAAFGLLTVAGAVGMVYDNVFIAQRRAGYILARNTLVVVLRLIVPALLVGLGAFGVFAAYWAAFAVALVPYLVVLRRSFPLRAPASLSRLRDMWRYSVGTYAATIILMLPTLLMPALVAERIGPEPAAYYYIASLLASVLLFIPQATGRGLFAEAVHEGGALRRHLPRVLRLTAVTQTPILLLIIVLGRPLLGLFGPPYVHAYPVLVLIAAANALSSVGYVGSTLLLISGRTRMLCLLSGAAYAISIVGGYLVADRGLVWIGAAILAGEGVLAAGYLRVISRALRADEPVRS